jgi:hypothetical protein
LRPASVTTRTVSSASDCSSERGDDDVGALARERERDGAADARVTAGDQRLAAFEPAAATVAVLAVVRLRIHRTLAAGVLEALLGLLGPGMLGRRVLRGGLIVSHDRWPPRYAAGAPRLVRALTGGRLLAVGWVRQYQRFTAAIRRTTNVNDASERCASPTSMLSTPLSDQ